MKVNEIFGGSNVVQGEGPFAGEPATFIRLFGCVPPYCKFCDTKYSWRDEQHESIEMSIDAIITRVIHLGRDKLVVITGGEPYAQKDIYMLCRMLKRHGFKIQIETSGKAYIDPEKAEEDKVCVIMSPKQYSGKFVVDKHFDGSIANYYKFVVESEMEVKNVVKFCEKYHITKYGTYLMAKGETRKKQLDLMPKIFEWCNKYGFKYSPRLHVLAFDKKRGV